MSELLDRLRFTVGPLWLGTSAEVLSIVLDFWVLVEVACLEAGLAKAERWR